MKDLQLDLIVQNVFDRDPPFVNNINGFVGYDPVNANPVGRFVSLRATKQF